MDMNVTNCLSGVLKSYDKRGVHLLVGCGNLRSKVVDGGTTTVSDTLTIPIRHAIVVV